MWWGAGVSTPPRGSVSWPGGSPGSLDPSPDGSCGPRGAGRSRGLTWVCRGGAGAARPGAVKSPVPACPDPRAGRRAGLAGLASDGPCRAGRAAPGL